MVSAFLGVGKGPSTNGVANARMEGAGIRLFAKIRGWLLVFCCSAICVVTRHGVRLSTYPRRPCGAPPQHGGGWWAVDRKHHWCGDILLSSGTTSDYHLQINSYWYLSRAPKIYRVIPSVRGGGDICIAHSHLNRVRIQDRVAVDLVVHPPVERGLGIATPINDLL